MGGTVQVMWAHYGNEHWGLEGFRPVPCYIALQISMSVCRRRCARGTSPAPTLWAAIPAPAPAMQRVSAGILGCTTLHGVTSRTSRVQKTVAASSNKYSHPTGESLGCGTACRSHSCPEGFCSNGGRCRLHPPSCTPTCECPPAFTDRHCVVAGGDFQPLASAGWCCVPQGAVTHPSSPSPETQKHQCSFIPRSAPEERAAVGQGNAKCHS